MMMTIMLVLLVFIVSTASAIHIIRGMTPSTMTLGTTILGIMVIMAGAGMVAGMVIMAGTVLGTMILGIHTGADTITTIMEEISLEAERPIVALTVDVAMR